jgi:hypothetical protein
MRRIDFSVFYSWQSDLDPRLGRNLVEAALTASVKALNVDGLIHGRLDRDIQGLSGTPDIVDAILEKIDIAEAFVAEVSITGATASGDPMSNANVMFELGYAVSRLSWNRIILVVNEAFGRSLPFDLGGTRRWPIHFQAANTASPEDIRATREALSVDLQRALRDIARLEHVRGLTPAGPVHLALSERFFGLSGFPREVAVPGKPAIELFVHGLQGSIVNTSDAPIRAIDGYVQLDRSSERFPLMLNRNGVLVPPSTLEVLPLHEEVAFCVAFSEDWATTQVEEDRFLRDFAPFTLYVTADGHQSTHVFSRERCQAVFRAWWDGVEEHDSQMRPAERLPWRK